MKNSAKGSCFKSPFAALLMWRSSWTWDSSGSTGMICALFPSWKWSTTLLAASRPVTYAFSCPHQTLKFVCQKTWMMCSCIFSPMFIEPPCCHICNRRHFDHFWPQEITNYLELAQLSSILSTTKSLNAHDLTKDTSSLSSYSPCCSTDCLVQNFGQNFSSGFSVLWWLFHLMGLISSPVFYLWLLGIYGSVIIAHPCTLCPQT